MYQYHFLYCSAQNYKLKARRNLFLSYNQLAELFAHIFGKTVESGVIPGQIVKDVSFLF